MQHGHLVNTRTALYFVYDQNASLLYVGIGLNPLVRLDKHSEKAWWSTIARIDVKWFDTRAEAEDAERDAIERLRPVHNVMCAVRNLPTPEPIIVETNRDKWDYVTRDSAARQIGLPVAVLKQCAEWGWLVPFYQVSPGAQRGRYLYTQVALDEFCRRWAAGDYALGFPHSRAELSA